MRAREVLRDTATHRQADHVGAAAGQNVDQLGRIGDQVAARIVRRARRRADRPAGVAMVVPDDESATRGQPPAQIGVPPVHRRRGTSDEQNRGRPRLAERLHTQIDPVDPHHRLSHDPRLYEDPTPWPACGHPPRPGQRRR